ncbi:branched-chain amino acid transport system II carrier protein, partial [Aerococcus sp. UMB9870]
FLLTMLGARSLEDIDLAQNGGEALIQIVSTKFGVFAGILLFVVMFVACLKTAIGLIISCAETFAEIYPNLLNQEKWTYV